MIDLLVRVIGNLGAIVTALSVVFGMNSPLLIQVILWVLVAVAIITIIIDVRNFNTKKPLRFTPNSKEVKEYMCTWLKSGGRAAVFSRDLSWAERNSEAEKILKEKAKRGELVLFVHVQTEIVSELQKLGANVHQYHKTFEPKARFTIVDYGRDGARLAIGLVEDKKHTIREYDARHPNVMALANDLVTLAQLHKPKKRSPK